MELSEQVNGIFGISQGSLPICSVPVFGSQFLPIGHLRRGVPWGCSEQKCFSSAIEVLRYHDGWGNQGPKDAIIDVPDAEEGGAVGAGAASPVEAWETEPVRGGGVDQAPVRADESRGQVLWETAH